jgi:mono/diheme cytochrome c family protein
MNTPVALYLPALLLGAVLAGFTANGFAQGKPAAKPDHNSGEYLYRTFCASCHGGAGQGDGPAARTLQRPLPDLTTIAVRSGGVFPRDTIARVIDGREPVAGHASTEMPKWGRILRSVEGDEVRVVQQRIDALVSHLESIQQK